MRFKGFFRAQVAQCLGQRLGSTRFTDQFPPRALSGSCVAAAREKLALGPQIGPSLVPDWSQFGPSLDQIGFSLVSFWFPGWFPVWYQPISFQFGTNFVPVWSQFGCSLVPILAPILAPIQVPIQVPILVPIQVPVQVPI